MEDLKSLLRNRLQSAVAVVATGILVESENRIEAPTALLADVIPKPGALVSRRGMTPRSERIADLVIA